MNTPRLQNSRASMNTPTSWFKALRMAPAKPVGRRRAKPEDAKNDAAAGLVDGVHPSAPLRQGYVDLQRGVQDTSRAPEADLAYKKLKR